MIETEEEQVPLPDQDQRRWVKLDDESVDPDNTWHLLEATTLNEFGIPMVSTKCGLTARWNQTFLDRLPGGEETAADDESVHDGCRALLGGATEPAPKGKSSKKG